MINMISFKSKTLFFLFLAILLLFSGCAKKTTVVLLPDPDGKVGHVTVSNEAGSTQITKAREATVISGRESVPSSPQKLSEEAINADFGQALAVLPLQPEHYILYFKNESTKLRADSKKTIPDILKAIEDMSSQNISVIGHADTAGNQQYNLQLSKKRAAAISRLLILNGVDEAYIKSTSHGENNPLVKTADNVHERKNRRVEVVIR